MLKFLQLVIISLIILPVGVRAQAGTRDVLLVLPFENSSTLPEYHWIGESFADALSELLNVPGLIVVSSGERESIYQRLNIPVTTLPSRATAIKLAREARATMVLLGTYTVIPSQNKNQVQVQGTARLIKVGEGRYEGRPITDASDNRRFAISVYDFGGALPFLQKMQGDLAYQVLYQRDRALPFSRNQFVDRATKVPQRAFESYVKGIMTSDLATREAYLTNALREYAKEKSGQVYSSAAFEMGQLNMDRRDWKTAADYFSKVEKQNKHYAEAAFYAGMSFYKMGNLGRALGELLPLSSELPLTTVYNNAGAVSIQSSLGAKDTDERARLVSQGLKLLERASASSPEDPIVRFNYAMALFLAARYKDSAEQLIPVITADPRDGQAHFLRAKALERSNAPEAQAADNEARKYLQSYARLQTQWQKNQAISDIPVRLYQSFNRRPYFDKLRSDVASTKGNARAGVQSQDLLLKAKQLYNEGRDDEALPELRRVLIAEPMSAEAYLLIGRINQRQGNLDAAISALKTAIFWDAKMIDAHILLGRIFLEKGDRAMAATYASSAIQLDQANQEAVALQRQVTMGKN